MLDNEVLLSKEIEGCYFTTQQLLIGLPNLLEAAQSPDLRRAILSQIRDSNHSLIRIELLAGFMGIRLISEEPQPITAAIEELYFKLKSLAPGPERDAVISATLHALLQIENGEYRCACSVAEQTTHEEAMCILERTVSDQIYSIEKFGTLISSHCRTEARV